MNEYMCRNYIAEKIVSEMTLSRIRRRFGVDDTEKISPMTRQSKLKVTLTNQLLEDEGSLNYKDWLTKYVLLM